MYGIKTMPKKKRSPCEDDYGGIFLLRNIADNKLAGGSFHIEIVDVFIVIIVCFAFIKSYKVVE